MIYTIPNPFVPDVMTEVNTDTGVTYHVYINGRRSLAGHNVDFWMNYVHRHLYLEIDIGL